MSTSFFANSAKVSLDSINKRLASNKALAQAVKAQDVHGGHRLLSLSPTYAFYDGGRPRVKGHG